MCKILLPFVYIFSEQGDKSVYMRGCMNPWPGYVAGDCWENEIPGYGKSKICFCGDDKCNGIDM